jgi:hypothetical protein
MDDDVGAVLDGPGECGGSKGVVHDQWNACLARNAGERVEIRHVQLRIPDGLHEEQPSAAIDGRSHLFQIVDVHEPRRDPPLGQGVRKQVVGAAVQRLRRDQVVPCAGQVQHREGFGSLAAGKGEPRRAALELRDPLFEYVVRRVHDPGVNVPELPEPEEIGRMGRVVEHVAGREVDRHGPGIGGGIGRLPGVHGESVGAKRHAVLLQRVANGSGA